MAIIFLGTNEETGIADDTYKMEINRSNMGQASSAHVKYMMVNGMKTCSPSVNRISGDLDVGSMLVFGTGSSMFIGTVVSGKIDSDGITAILDNSWRAPGTHHDIYRQFLTEESRLWDVPAMGEASRRAIDDIINGRSDLKITTDNPLVIESKPEPSSEVHSNKYNYQQMVKGLEEECDFDNMATVDYIDIRNLPQSTAEKAKACISGLDSWHYDFIKPIIDNGYHIMLSEDNETMFVDVSKHDLNLMNTLERYCHENGKCFLSWDGEYFLKTMGL